MDRKQHLEWAKKRALAELAHSGSMDAVASMTSDLSKHEAWQNDISKTLFLLGMMEISNGKDAVRRWIEGWN